MILPPQARFKFYGSPGIYLNFVKDLLFNNIYKGESVALLESKISELSGATYSIAVPQARVGIYLAVKSLIKPGQEVILSPYTIYDVVNMVISAGGVPVFADIVEETCNIDPAKVEELVNEKTGAVLATHLHGLTCDIERLSELCKKKNIALIEDCAQSFGAKQNGKWLGAFGDAGIFSFGRVKHINSFFGGLVVTSSENIRDNIRLELDKYDYEDKIKLSLRAAHCLSGDIATSNIVFPFFTFWLFRYGALHDVRGINKLVDTEDNPVLHERIPEEYKRRFTPMQARLVLNQLGEYESHIRERILRAKMYHEGLSTLEGILLPPLLEDESHIYLSYPVQIPKRWEFVKFMMKKGRDLAIQHYSNTADLPQFKAYYRDCPVARMVAEKVVFLPVYPGYRKSEIRKTIRVTKEYF